MLLTLEQIEEAQRWLGEQRAVVHPGPIETIREALSLARLDAIEREGDPRTPEFGVAT